MALILLAVVLVVSGSVASVALSAIRAESARNGRRVKELSVQNTDLRAVIDHIDTEAQLRIAAGESSYQFTRDIIDHHNRKALG